MKNHEFRGGKAAAVKYEVEIDGKKIPVFLPKKPDAKAGEVHGIAELAKGLAALPGSSRALVKQVVVEARQNPDDAFWARQYNDPNFRSYMTAGAEGIISVYPSKQKVTQDYLDGTLIHETGHTLSTKKWGSNDNDTRWNDWKAAVKSDGILPSQYGKASAGEDFAETVDAKEVPASIRFAPNEAGELVPVVKGVAMQEGDRRIIREYGPEGQFLRSTVQVRTPGR